MANEFIARNGLIAQNNSTITGSLNVTGGITGSLLGTASYVTTAQTASYVLNAISASYASSASYYGGTVTSASYASSSTSASYASSISPNYTTDFLPVTFDGQQAEIALETSCKDTPESFQLVPS